jgi:hypothetical protein
VNGRRLFVVLVVVALGVLLAFRHRVERGLGLGVAATAATLSHGGGQRGRTPTRPVHGAAGRGGAPPTASYAGASAITAFYADLSRGKGPEAYALLAPTLASRLTPNAFGRRYAGVKSAHVRFLAPTSVGALSRTFTVTVAFTLTSGRVQTRSGSVTVQNQSGGVGAPDWAISAVSVTP